MFEYEYDIKAEDLIRAMEANDWTEYEASGPNLSMMVCPKNIIHLIVVRNDSKSGYRDWRRTNMRAAEDFSFWLLRREIDRSKTNKESDRG